MEKPCSEEADIGVSQEHLTLTKSDRAEAGDKSAKLTG